MNGLPAIVRRSKQGGFVMDIRYPSGTLETIHGPTVAALKEAYLDRRESYLDAMEELEIERRQQAYEDRYWEEGR